MRKWFGMLLMSMLLMAGCMQVSAAESGVLALGANLSDSQKAEVYAQMGITAEQAASYQTIYITNDMEHQYLDASLGASVVGTHSLSSVLLIPQESGAGLNVETHNINYCTISMYRNALLTAGVEDAKVIVAAPSPMSGTAALVGAVKAYDLIAYLKQQIAENHLDDPDKLADLVRQAAEEMGITLTDEQVSQIVDLLLKLSKLDIDPDKLANQAKELYNKLESMGITVDKEKVGNFITNFVSSIWELIQSFLNR